jgi:hypothetical protein
VNRVFVAIIAILLLAPAAGHAFMKSAAEPAPPAVTGTAVEVLEAGGYTFVSVEMVGKKTWVALPQMKIAVGDKVTFRKGDEIPVLESPTLKRKFEKIILSSGPTFVAAPAEAPQQKVAVSGKVAEVLESGGYTYVRVENAGKSTWVAIPAMKMTIGSEVTFAAGDEMKNFPSKTLNRTFESIIFSGGPVTPAKGNMAKSSTAQGTKSAASGKISVEKAPGTDAYTVAELYKLKGKLDKKKVTVRGKVVKVSTGIMKRNWIHLQDGTGSKKKKTNNLVVTSDANAEEGDVITIKGTLAKDKDFGSGYKYEVIVEKAVIVH